MNLITNPNQLEVYTEIRKRRIRVGNLAYLPEQKQYKFEYDKNYISSKQAIPLGPELDLFKKVHLTKGKELFPSFYDRIPSRSNPAFEEYCRSVGISVNEKNLIVLLTTIGRSGPSTFVFEPVLVDDFATSKLIQLREVLGLSRHEFSRAFGLNVITVTKIEQGKSKDSAPARLIQIFLKFPQVALWQLEQSGRHISQNSLHRMRQYFQKQI